MRSPPSARVSRTPSTRAPGTACRTSPCGDTSSRKRDSSARCAWCATPGCACRACVAAGCSRPRAPRSGRHGSRTTAGRWTRRRCGAAPPPGRDIAAARRMVADGLARLAPYAAERGVRLGIEPMHPAFAAERSCITTLREARCLAECFDPATVGSVADVYHIWWDPDLYEELGRAAGRLVAFHVSDWLVPVQDVLMNRGMMGDGVIELRRIREAVERAGYGGGPIEVEIFNEAVWSTPLDALLPLVKERYLACV